MRFQREEATASPRLAKLIHNCLPVVFAVDLSVRKEDLPKSELVMTKRDGPHGIFQLRPACTGETAAGDYCIDNLFQNGCFHNVLADDPQESRPPLRARRTLGIVALV